MNTYHAHTPDGIVTLEGYRHTSKPSHSSKRSLLPDGEVLRCVGCDRHAYRVDDGEVVHIIDGEVPDEVLAVLADHGLTVIPSAKPVIEVGRTGNDLGITVTTPDGEVVNPYTTACLPECKRCNGSKARKGILARLARAYLAHIGEVGEPL